MKPDFPGLQLSAYANWPYPDVICKNNRFSALKSSKKRLPIRPAAFDYY
jgi:hypothetical protein